MAPMGRLFLLVLILGCAAYGQHQHETAKTNRTSLLPGLGRHHHPISTRSADAQKFFDEGLTLIYAFNHEEAIRSFERAAALDPSAAMPYWGIALALGPNINLDVDPAGEKRAYAAAKKALAMRDKAAENERAYIDALAKRYSIDPKADLKKLAMDYKDAMGELVKRYPDDLDAATLYAEAMMDLRPWQLWTADGKPAEGTEEIVRVLESVLKRDPQHIGTNHYYIHAVEASRTPERALASAARLPGLVPQAGHLVHMPAHIYIQTGDYESAARSNEQAAEVDRNYIRKTGVSGVYPLMYYSHNLHFLAAARTAQGRFEDARRAAAQLVANVAPAVKEMPMLEGFLPTPLFVLLRFNRWADILKLPAPDSKLALSTAVWHFGRGCAFAATGDVKNAASERASMVEARKQIPPDIAFNLNSAENVFRVADAVLSARIAAARGDTAGSIENWRKAVEAQDALAYDEPPGWYYPVRESLGAALLKSGRAVEAEAVFREDLTRNARSGRSLFGLLESLKAQKKSSDAQWVERQFGEAWKGAPALRVGDL
jgi:tetratricopeptide (TPR) repeat protein